MYFFFCLYACVDVYSAVSSTRAKVNRKRLLASRVRRDRERAERDKKRKTNKQKGTNANAGREKKGKKKKLCLSSCGGRTKTITHT